MIFDRTYDGPQEVTGSDRLYAGSRFAEVRAALFANAYYLKWGGPGESPLPTYDVTLGRALRGVLSFGKGWHFLQAARRTLESHADLRWGPDGRGFRRILHPNGVCLTGTWEIDDAPDGTAYTGYFQQGSRALIVGRYSTCCAETRSGHYRSLALVGKLYPTTDPNHAQPYRTADFITQQDLGGAWSPTINDAEFRNAPDTTPWRRGPALPVLLLTALVFKISDKQPTIRQLYPIAELGKPDAEPTRAPEFMRLVVHPDQPRMPGHHLDFRDEVLAQIYDKGESEPRRTLTFNIEVSDQGHTKGLFGQRHIIKGWKRIGRIIFVEAVASYNGDFVLHFHHPPWRNDRNDGSSIARTRIPSGSKSS
jgi:hypothetical protein